MAKTWVNDFLEKKKVKFKFVEHKKPGTKAELAKLRGLPIDRIVKVLLFKADKEIVLCVLPVESMIDNRKLRKVLRSESLKFASPKDVDVVKKKTEGILPPVIEGLKKIVDKSLATSGKISFSTALDDSSGIIVDGKEMISILDECIVEGISQSVTEEEPVARPVPEKKSIFSGKNFLSIAEAMKKGSGSVNVRGWIHRERGSSKIKFVVLRDSTQIIQCVIVRSDVGDEKFSVADKLQVEASLEIRGEIKKDDRAPTGYEVLVKDFEVIGESDTYPITKDQSPEFLLDKRHLWLRSRKMIAIMKIRSTITGAIHDFFRSKGYHEFNPPIFQPAQCEGGSTLFEVKYYNTKTYLTQSWQLYAEAAVFALEKVYDMSPTFRAEKSKTSRHLSEFWMAEMEAAWMKLDECAELAKEEIAFIVAEVLKKNRGELEILGRDVAKLKKIKLPFPTITYTGALDILKKKCEMDVKWGKDLRTIEEDKLMEHFDKPVVVTHYPKEIMAFYKPKDPEDPKTALCFDMLAPEGYGEIVGGSERETDVDSLMGSLKKMGEDPKNYDWYIDLRRYGSVPHSGYGLGVERVVAWICGIDNIKDAIPFPRTMLRWWP